MTDEIRFRVHDSVTQRVESVIKARAKHTHPETVSDFARIGFFMWLIDEERRLGLLKPSAQPAPTKTKKAKQ